MRITNEILKLYVQLKNEEKLIQFQLNDLRNLIIEHNGANTGDYIAVVKEMSKRQVATIKEFEEIMGSGWLENQDLIKTILYKQVEVFLKPKKTVKLPNGVEKNDQEKSII